jgi:hypothetical protein
MYIPSVVIVQGDAVTTASNIVSNEFLFRVGILGSLITQLIHIFAVVLLFTLFESVNKIHSRLLVILGMLGVPIAMLNELNNVAAILSLNNPDQMMLFLDLNSQGILIAQIFWGLWLFPLGYLVVSSVYFPKLLGVVLYFAGIGYLMASFINLLMPNLDALLSITTLLTFGEIVFIAWLVIKGAKITKQDARA